MAQSGRDALQHFVQQSRERLNIILQRLQWTEAGVLQSHHGDCSMLKKQEASFPPSYPDSGFCIQLDEPTLRQILQTNTASPSPQSYTTKQKLLIYQYVLEQTPCQRPVFEDDAAFAKMVAVTKREQFKQRRYRKSKPTHNEQLHQLLELQMKALTQQQQISKESITIRHRQDQRRQRRHSRSPDSSRRDNRSNKKERHRSKHKYKRSRSRSRSRSRTRYHSSRQRNNQNKH
ncbi:luc7-like protein 3 [Drosophila tropicalis]|uniref:luc7-like protein 3 n=1 Tax=Drosophila tropicalis TaxID=46794 RepID=UPI0035ABA815